MKRLTVYVGAALMAASAAFAQTPVDDVVEYSLRVEDFTELKVLNAVNVDYRCSADSAGWVYFSCRPSVAPHLMFSNKKSSLKVQVDYDVSVSAADLPTVRVYSSSLSKVENAADSTVRVLSTVPGNTFKAILDGNGTLIVRDLHNTNVDASIRTGNGHLVVSGKARSAKLSNVGTGTLEAGGLDAVRVKCVSFGTGPIDCTVSEQLTIVGAGSGKVYYSGAPQKITNRAIGVSAVKVEN